MAALPSSSPSSLELLLAALIASLLGLGAIVAGAGLGAALPARPHPAITSAPEPDTIDGEHSPAADDNNHSAARLAISARHTDFPRQSNRAPAARVAGRGELQRLRAALSFADSAQPSGSAMAPAPPWPACPLVPLRLCR